MANQESGGHNTSVGNSDAMIIIENCNNDNADVSPSTITVFKMATLSMQLKEELKQKNYNEEVTIKSRLVIAMKHLCTMKKH